MVLSVYVMAYLYISAGGDDLSASESKVSSSPDPAGDAGKQDCNYCKGLSQYQVDSVALINKDLKLSYLDSNCCQICTIQI